MKRLRLLQRALRVGRKYHFCREQLVNSETNALATRTFPDNQKNQMRRRIHFFFDEIEDLIQPIRPENYKKAKEDFISLIMETSIELIEFGQKNELKNKILINKVLLSFETNIKKAKELTERLEQDNKRREISLDFFRTMLEAWTNYQNHVAKAQVGKQTRIELMLIFERLLLNVKFYHCFEICNWMSLQAPESEKGVELMMAKFLVNSLDHMRSLNQMNKLHNFRLIEKIPKKVQMNSQREFERLLSDFQSNVQTPFEILSNIINNNLSKLNDYYLFKVLKYNNLSYVNKYLANKSFAVIYEKLTKLNQKLLKMEMEKGNLDLIKEYFYIQIMFFNTHKNLWNIRFDTSELRKNFVDLYLKLQKAVSNQQKLNYVVKLHLINIEVPFNRSFLEKSVEQSMLFIKFGIQNLEPENDKSTTQIKIKIEHLMKELRFVLDFDKKMFEKYFEQFQEIGRKSETPF